MDLSKIRALAWDIGGTVFDMERPVRDEVQRLASLKGVKVAAGKFTDDWLSITVDVIGQMSRGQLPQMGGDGIRRKVWEQLTKKYPALELTPSNRDTLDSALEQSKAFPGAADAIAKLRSKYTVVALTMMSFRTAVHCSKVNGIVWDGILSCEFLGHYKPDLETYRQALKFLGLMPEQVVMVAAHKWDLAAARSAGLHTAYISDPEGSGKSSEQDISPRPSFDIAVTGFKDLVHQLVA